MFYVYEKDSEYRVKIPVYDIQYKYGYPFFTIYKDDKWITRSAKHYVPIDNTVINNKIEKEI